MGKRSAVPTGMKRCSKCKKIKPQAQFNRNARRKDRLSPKCKACKALRYRKQGAMLYERHLQRVYGLAPEDYAQMLEAQGGCCAICGKVFEEGKWRPDVDHDHETHSIRGLLCRSCNLALGHLQDSPELCEAAAQYLRERL